jgi:ABC-type multidrug transport system fused ATPase/permease subunit
MRELLPLLPSNARRFLLLFGVLSALLALLDAAALGVFALVLNQILKGGTMVLPVFGSVSQEFGLALLVGAALVMILKSVLSIWLQWVSTRRFAEYEMEIGTVLFQSYIRAPWTERMKRSTTELVRMIDVGIANTVAGVLFPP